VKSWGNVAVTAAVAVCSPGLIPFFGTAAGSARADNVPAINGNRPASDPGHFTFGHFDELEGQLQADLNGGADEIFALLSGGYWGDDGQIIVRVASGKARLIFTPDHARTFERSLDADELRELRAFLTKVKAFNLDQLKTDIADGMQYELVHLTKAGGQRVFMNNPLAVDAHPYADICRRFRALLGKPGLTLHYAIEKTNPDIRVLVSDPVWAVSGVHMDGSQLLLRLTKGQRRWGEGFAFPAQHRLKLTIPAPEPSESTWVSWPSLAPIDRGRLAALSLVRIPIPGETVEWLNNTGWASEHGGARYFVADDGLRQISAQGQDVLIVAGKMASPLVAADGGTVLVDRTDQRVWGHKAYFALVDTRTRQVRRVDIATANNMIPIMPTPSGFLVERERASREALPENWGFEGPESPEYFLVATSGAVKKVDGDFAPLVGILKSPPQLMADKTFWAVKTDWKKRISVLGRYDLERFVFTPVRELRGLALGTPDIWVDEPGGQAYGLYDGDLVGFSLRPN
jgi:hypothetical protein